MPQKAPYTNFCLGWCGKKPFPAYSKFERFCKKCRAKKEGQERNNTIYLPYKIPQHLTTIRNDK